jgi:hypothetical protein
MQIEMNLENAFNGDSKKVESIGGLTSLKIGPATFEALAAKLCIDKGKPTTAVAVLSTLEWPRVQPGDTLCLMGLVNSKGKSKLLQLINSQDSVEYDVTFGVKVARPDDEKNQWYAELTADSVQGITDKNIGDKGLEVSNVPDRTVHGGTETYYRFRIWVGPNVKVKSVFQYAALAGGPQPVNWGQK